MIFGEFGLGGPPAGLVCSRTLTQASRRHPQRLSRCTHFARSGVVFRRLNVSPHLGIGLVPVDSEAMACGGAVDRAPAETVEREPPVVVEVLEHVAHRLNRLTVLQHSKGDGGTKRGIGGRGDEQTPLPAFVLSLSLSFSLSLFLSGQRRRRRHVACPQRNTLPT